MCVVTFDFEENDAVEKAASFMKNRRLSWAIIEVTDSCNLNCIWCYANSGYGMDRQRKHMPFENLKKLLSGLSGAGVRQVTFSGGEPTIYPHIREAVKTAKDMGFVVHMNTNGILMTAEFAKELKDRGLSQIQTNIDSINPAKHDYIRGLQGSFQRAVLALKNAKEAGMTAVCQTVLTSMNEDEIIDIFRFARSLGVQRCRLWDMTPSEGTAISNVGIAPSNYAMTLERLYELSLGMGLKTIESGEPMFPLDRKMSVPVTGGFCVSYFGASTTVSVDGDAFYCATYRKPLYNVFAEPDQDIGELHRQKLAEFISVNIKPKDSCSGCQFIKKCAGGCIVKSEASLQNADVRHCHLEKPMLSSL